MAINGKKMGLYATAGVLIAFIIIASMAVSSLTMPSLRFPWFTPPSPPIPNTGTLIIKLTDAPVELEHLNITIDSISAHRVGYGKEGTWVDLVFVDGVEWFYFDLLALENVTRDLSITEVPPGNYTMIKMHITTCNATYANGTIEPKIDVPSEDVRVIIKFGVKKQQVRTILIDMEPDWVALSHNKQLKPVLKAKVID